ncbi:hypothetical protein FA95DRAFT_540370 [Auriscalpium vulgare]|uniref:Uncharacterized protein n=1 Tax=Auriscalpium vulgare TaxID=40419 RepID=A0ACB8RFL6_9AGAM|nr:hypothetical protein FA95DRAFT_540370 [Auriscalpium vulgare]
MTFESTHLRRPILGFEERRRHLRTSGRSTTTSSPGAHELRAQDMAGLREQLELKFCALGRASSCASAGRLNPPNPTGAPNLHLARAPEERDLRSGAAVFRPRCERVVQVREATRPTRRTGEPGRPTAPACCREAEHEERPRRGRERQRARGPGVDGLREGGGAGSRG